MTRSGFIKTLLFLACLLSSQYSHAATQSGDLVELKTDSALHSVYFFPAKNSGEVLVSVTILAGEVDSTAPEGLSHYLEHLVFWHADQVDGKTLHARKGNAWVNGIVTNYYNSADASELDDMFQFAARVLQPPELDKNFMLEERAVVAREYDLRVSENPIRQAYSGINKTLYAGNPLGRSTIGTKDSIASLSILQSMAFHKQYYHPSNVVLYVMGDTSERAVKRLVKKYFSKLPGGTPNLQAWRDAAIETGPDESIQLMDPLVSHDRLAYTSLSEWSGNESSLQDEYTLQLLADTLVSALPGSLSKPLRLDEFVISSYDLELRKLLANQVQLSILAVPDEGISLDTVSRKLQQALVNLAAQGVPDKTLKRIKKRRLQAAEREASNGYVTFWRAQRHLSLGIKPTSPAEHLLRLHSVSKADIDDALKALANPVRRVNGYVTPR